MIDKGRVGKEAEREDSLRQNKDIHRGRSRDRVGVVP